MAFTYTCTECGTTYTQAEHSEDERCPDCREGVQAL
jgi:DNA-directed RNA polymerase subunit RPC12/RpoP